MNSSHRSSIFKTAPKRPHSKPDWTSSQARAIIEGERRELEKKTARLRGLREAKEAEAALASSAVSPLRPTRKTRKR